MPSQTFSGFIDYIVLGRQMAQGLVTDSFGRALFRPKDALRRKLSDHCPVFIRLRVADADPADAVNRKREIFRRNPLSSVRFKEPSHKAIIPAGEPDEQNNDGGDSVGRAAVAHEAPRAHYGLHHHADMAAKNFAARSTCRPPACSSKPRTSDLRKGQQVELAFAINLGAVTKLHRRTAVVAHVSRGGTGLMMDAYTAR